MGRSSLGIVVGGGECSWYGSLNEHRQVRQDSGMLWLDSLMEATNGNARSDPSYVDSLEQGTGFQIDYDGFE
ncbi:hypothetical protein HPP92_028574 [Vanilla planifolia]|uniref:Uncharacterized protein n=1 Tax=Vanilla planifolia TaxID=51239 RepID=A0A835P7K3_VANPL|nr:hypothetical protein HPP92_028574 [Vanilla planifolia]